MLPLVLVEALVERVPALVLLVAVFCLGTGEPRFVLALGHRRRRRRRRPH